MVQLDDVDLHLLALLSDDGRATFSDLASRVNLSVAATKRRVDRLRAQNVITGFTATVDHAALGRPAEAFTEVRYVGTSQPDEMMAEMTQIPEVEAVYTIAGDPDMLVKVRARDHSHLQQVINHLRRGGKATGTKTMIVLGSWHR
ncbi:Lrp/AsnC family transcriptional regulator [Gordonia sp. VNK1]|jgi:DNA-binding Lrp family transcriptional regulator|uniref:Lrp/AsnC family transcriptional regulator n=1 Tax=Gordonia oleivorans TaxID=3156618 RepID=UPI0032B3329F